MTSCSRAEIPPLGELSDAPPSAEPVAAEAEAGGDFDAIYEAHADFVWRSIRRLGVETTHAEDVFQEIFIVVHRRLATFDGTSTHKTWLFGIVLGVVRNHRRALRRRPVDGGPEAEISLSRLASESEASPERSALRSQATEMLHAALQALDEDKREVFVLAELEQLRGSEIAVATGLNQRTVYARLKAARAQFNQAVARLQAQHGRRRPT